MQEDHQRTVDLLQHQLDMAERDNGQLQNRLQNLLRDHSPEHEEHKNGEGFGHQGILDLRHEERESGEVGNSDRHFMH